MIKNIVFDIGNVILRYDPFSYLLSQYDDYSQIEYVYKNVFNSKEWLELDRGTLDYKKASEIISKKTKLKKEDILYDLNNWKYKSMGKIESTNLFIDKLKDSNKYNLYLLSNFHEDAFNYVKKKYDFVDKFDGGVISYREKLLKPEEAIYIKLLSKYNLKAEESIFIDDSKANIDKAIELGFEGVVFSDTSDILKIIEKLS